MERFIMIVEKRRLSVRRNEDGVYIPQYILGSEFRSYTSDTIEDEVRKIVSELIGEYNLESATELELSVFESEEVERKGEVLRILTSQMQTIPKILKQDIITSAIPKLLQKLKRDGIFGVDEYGVNFEGVNYRRVGKALKKEPFSLLAYSITYGMLLEALPEQ